MGGLFRVSEIVDMAIDEEHNGVFFYQALADRAQDEAAKRTASRLAQEERDHEQRFIALKKKLGAYAPPESYPGEYADYVNALVEGRTFPSEEEAAAIAAVKKDPAGWRDVLFDLAVRPGYREY